MWAFVKVSLQGISPLWLTLVKQGTKFTAIFQTFPTQNLNPWEYFEI